MCYLSNFYCIFSCLENTSLHAQLHSDSDVKPKGPDSDCDLDSERSDSDSERPDSDSERPDSDSKRPDSDSYTVD